MILSYCNIERNYYLNRPITAAEMQLLLKTQDGKVLRFIAAPVVETQVHAKDNQTKEKSVVKAKVPLNNYKKVESKTVEGQKLSAAKMVSL